MNPPKKKDVSFEEFIFERYHEESDYYLDVGYNQAISDFHKWIDEAPMASKEHLIKMRLPHNVHRLLNAGRG